MADAIGVDGIHAVSGMCDLCGDPCDPNSHELNVLSCSFSGCNDTVYHQDCVEKYLKSIRLERNRKTGFKCPRGCGKGTTSSSPCPGRIDKSHPIHPRNEEAKRKKKAQIPLIALVNTPKPAAKPSKTKAVEPVKKAEAAKDKTAQQEAKRKQGVTKIGVVNVAVKSSVPMTMSKLEADLAALRSRKDAVHKEAKSVTRDFRDPVLAVAPAQNAWGKPNTLLKTVPVQVSISQPLARAPPPKAPAAPPTPVHQHVVPPGLHLGLTGHSSSSTSVSASVSSTPLHPGHAQPSKAVETLVGATFMEETEEQKRHKAQKKNQKRAERRKRAIAAETTSTTSITSAPSMMSEVASSEQECAAQVEQAEAENMLHELCINILAAHKTLQCIQQLFSIGFQERQCFAAVQRFGSNLEAAVSWLIGDDPVLTDDLLQAEIDSEHAPEVDITDEIEHVNALAEAYSLPLTSMWQLVADYHGDLDQVLAALGDKDGDSGSAGTAYEMDRSSSSLSGRAFASSVDGSDSMGVSGNSSQDAADTLPTILGQHLGSASRMASDASTPWSKDGSHAGGVEQRPQPKPQPAGEYGTAGWGQGSVYGITWDMYQAPGAKPTDVPEAPAPQQPFGGAFIDSLEHYNRLVGLSSAKSSNFSLFCKDDPEVVPPVSRVTRAPTGEFSYAPPAMGYAYGDSAVYGSMAVDQVDAAGVADERELSDLVATLMCR